MFPARRCRPGTIVSASFDRFSVGAPTEVLKTVRVSRSVISLGLGDRVSVRVARLSNLESSMAAAMPKKEVRIRVNFMVRRFAVDGE